MDNTEKYIESLIDEIAELKSADSDYQSQIAILEQKVKLNYEALLVADSVNKQLKADLEHYKRIAMSNYTF